MCLTCPEVHTLPALKARAPLSKNIVKMKNIGWQTPNSILTEKYRVKRSAHPSCVL